MMTLKRFQKQIGSSLLLKDRGGKRTGLMQKLLTLAYPKCSSLSSMHTSSTHA